MKASKEQQDVVIIGSGPSGCALASALVRSGLRVLLIEAGDAEAYKNASAADMGRWMRAATTSAITFPYETVPQASLNGRRIPSWRGRGGGGSTLVNASLYMRGRREDYAAWPWAIVDIEDSFNRVEAQVPLEVAPAVGIGALQCEMFRQAGGHEKREERRRPGDGFAAEEKRGSPTWCADGVDDFMWVTGVIGSGRRRSAWEHFIKPVLAMPNLTILDGTTVVRLVFDGDKVCKALECRCHDHGAAVTLPVAAGADVFVCAGAFDTPKLLMLSGVGPAAHLVEVGVAVVADAPLVGGNLQDHMLVCLGNLGLKPITPEMENTVGVHGMVHGSYCGRRVQFLVGDSRDAAEKLPLMAVQPLMRGGWALTALAWLLRWLVALALMLLPPLRRGARGMVGMAIALTEPASRGTVRLRSRDPRAAPLVDPGYLGSEEEWAALWTAFQAALKVQETPLGREWFGKQMAPGALYKEGADEESFRAFVRSSALSYFHPVGTCSMGVGKGGGTSSGGGNGSGNGATVAAAAAADTTTDSVVSAETLKVHGFRNLRVADCSIAPRIPSVPTQAMGMMIGDMAAKILLAEAASRHKVTERVAAANSR